MSVMKRLIDSNKRQAGISLSEEKKAMSFDFYTTLCDILHQVEGEAFISAHTFLQWNGI